MSVPITFKCALSNIYVTPIYIFTNMHGTASECPEIGPGCISAYLVLVRKNNQGTQVAKVLTEAGIQVTSSESLLVAQSPEVQFLINLVKINKIQTLWN